MSAGDVAKLTYKAVSYFKSDSGFCDFVASLVTAEKELFNGSHASDVKTVVTERGLGEFHPDSQPACVSSNAQNALEQSSSTTGESSSKKKSDSNPLIPGCGRIDGAASHGMSPEILIGLLLLPLSLLIKVPKRLPVRIPRTTKPYTKK
jgi:hypothetical protein